MSDGDRYPFLPFRTPVPKYYCAGCSSRLWEQAVVLKNCVKRCPYCNSLLLTHATVFRKPRTKKKETIPLIITPITPGRIRQTKEYGVFEWIGFLIGVIIAIVLLGGK